MRGGTLKRTGESPADIARGRSHRDESTRRMAAEPAHLTDKPIRVEMRGVKSRLINDTG
jgi:hypothetical protein